MTTEEIVARVGDNPGYREAFSAIDRSPIVLDDVLMALAAFVRSLETGATAYDRWLEGDHGALSASASRGRQLFFARAQCATCHTGPALTDHDFHNIGTGNNADNAADAGLTTDQNLSPDQSLATDLGHFEVTGKDADRGRFKTPSLRNWQGNEPFMHDGRFANIEQVLEHYSNPASAELSKTVSAVVGVSELDPLQLSEAETQDLLAFLKALNGALPNLESYQDQWRRLAPSDTSLTEVLDVP